MGVAGLESHLDILVPFGAQIFHKLRGNFPMNAIKVPYSSAYFPRLYNGLQWSGLENSPGVWKTARLTLCSQSPVEATAASFDSPPEKNKVASEGRGRSQDVRSWACVHNPDISFVKLNPVSMGLTL